MCVVMVFAASSTVYVPKWAIACPTGLRGLSDADFERSADIICQENQPLALYMAIPLTPGFAACAGAVGTMLSLSYLIVFCEL